MKVLGGSLRKTFAFFFAEWRSLLGVCLAPLVASIVLAVAQMAMFRYFFEKMMGTMLPGEFNPEALNPVMFNAMIQLQAFSIVSQIITLLVTAYLLVRIVRLYMYGERGVFDFSKPVITASLMTALYSLGIIVLTMVVFVVAFFLVMILVMIIVGMAALGPSNSLGEILLLVLLMSGGGTAVSLFVLWFGARFAVGLPAVALGKAPDFFTEMWRLSRGESWGVPLRLVALYVLMWIVLLPVVAFLAYRMFSQISALDIRGTPGEEAGRLMMESMLSGFTWCMPVFTIVSTIFAALGAVLLTEAYLRFMKRDGKAVA